MELLELFKRQLASKSGSSSKNTIKNYVSDVRHFIAWFEAITGSKFDPSSVTTDVILLYQNGLGGLVLNGQLQSGTQLSASSMKRHLSSIRKFFTVLEAENVVRENPFTKIITEESVEPTDYWHLKSFKDYLMLGNASKITVKNYLSDISGFARWYEEAILPTIESPLSSNQGFYLITQSVVEDYRKRLVEIQNAAPRTINRKLSALRRYLEFATRKGFITNQEISVSSVEADIADDVADLPKVALSEMSEKLSPQKRSYSNIPPVRLIQKLLINPYLLLEEGAANAITGFLIGKKVTGIANLPQKLSAQIATKNALRIQNQGISTLLGVRNIEKEFYAPDKVSLSGLPVHQKLIHHVRFTRPNWYKRYHNYAFVHYVHFALLVIFAAGVGVALYQNLVVQKQTPTFAAATAPPRILSFQGRLTDALDNPITSPQPVRFMIYNSLAATGAAELWEETRTISPDQDGIFSVLLGSDSTGANASSCGSFPPGSPYNTACLIPSTVFSDNSQIWLGVTIANSTELAPRQKIATVGYATNSEFLQGLPPTSAVSSFVNAVLALDSTGSFNLNDGIEHTFQVSNGTLTLKAQTLNLTTSLGTNGNIILNPEGLGKVDIQKPIINNSNTGNLVRGGVEINDRFGVLATESAVAAFIVNNNTTGGDIFAASSSGTTKFKIANDGSITSGFYTGQNAVLYGTQTTGLIAQATTASTGLCLQSGASTPTWGTCGSSYWNLTTDNGALTPFSSTLDLLIGGQSTASAKFAFINNASGAPTASISGNLAIAVPTGASGANLFNIFNGGSLNFQTSGGGNAGLTSRLFIANDGRIGIATTSPIAKNALDVRGISGTGSTATISARSSFAALVVNNDGLGDIFAASASGVQNFVVKNNGDIIVGPDGGGKITAAIIDPYLVQNQKTTGITSLTLQTMGGAGADIIFSNQSSDLVHILQNGNVGIGVTNPTTAKLVVGGDIGADVVGRNIGSLSIPFNNLYANNIIATGPVSGFWGQTLGSLYPANPTVDLLIGSSATSTAKFAVLNINTGTPTASVSAQNAGGQALVLASDGSIQTTRRNSLAIGGSSTGSIQFLPNNNSVNLFLTGSNAAIGNQTPQAALDVSSSSLISSVVNKIVFGSIGTAMGSLGYDGSSFNEIRIGATSNVGLELITNDTVRGYFTATGLFGLGTVSPVAQLQVNGTNGSNATVIINQGNNGDILAASASGTTKFVIKNNGIASSSAGFTIDGLGALQSTNFQTLTIGGNSTGNVVVSPNNGSGQIQFTNFTSAGGLLYTGATGILAQTNVGSGTQCLLGGTTPTFGTCGGPFRELTAFGTIVESNTTEDFLLGGVATSSAKFAVLNIAGGTPTASVSAQNAGGQALVLGGDGTIQAVRNNNLTLGGNTTGSLVLAGTSIQLSATNPIIDLTTASTLSINTTTNRPITTGTGLTTLGGNLTVNGATTSLASTAITLTGSSPIIDLTSGTTLSINTTTNRPITTGTGLTTLGGNLTVAGATTTFSNATPVLTSNTDTSLTITPNGTGNLILTSDLDTGVKIGASTNTLAPLSVSGGIGGNALSIFNQINGTDILAASASGVSKFVIKNDGTASSSAGFTVDGIGTIQSTRNQTLTVGGGSTGNLVLGKASQTLTLPGFTTNGGLLYTNASGVLAQTGTGGATQCLLGGAGTPTFGSCGTGVNSSPFYEIPAPIGVIAQANLTEDFLLGGLATSSAKFAVLNIAGGTPTASVSAQNAAGQALVLSGDGTIQSTRNNSLTLGGNTTGSLVLAGTSVQLSATNPIIDLTSSSTLFINTTTNRPITTGTGLTTHNGNLTVAGATITFSNASPIITSNTNTDLTITPNGTGNLILTSDLDTGVKIGSSTNTIAPLSVSGGIGSNALAIFNQINGTDILTASASGVSKFVIKNDGTASSSAGFTIDGIGAIQSTRNQTLTVGGGATGNLVIGRTAQTVTLPGFTTNGGLLYTNASGVLAQTGTGGATQCLLGGAGTPTFGSCGTGVNSSPFYEIAAQGIIVQGNTSEDFLLGATATSSAKFAVLNIAGGTPTASVSAQNAAGQALVLGSDGSIQSTRNNNLTIGGNTTGSLVLPGTSIQLTGNNPVIDLTTASTLSLNTTNNRPITTGTGTFTVGSGGTGTIAMNGSAITTTTTSVSLFDANATTINFGRAGTNNINLGGTSGALNVGNGGSYTIQTTSNGQLNVSAGSGLLTLNTLSNGAVTTGNGLTTLGGNLTVSGTTISLAGTSPTISTTGSNSLTLTAAGAGSLTLSSDSDSSIFVGNATTPAPLSISGGIGNNAALVLNQLNSTGNIFSASASGVSKFVIKNDGTASSSAGFTVDGIGNIQSTLNQTLTIGGGSTGNLILGKAAQTLTLPGFTTNGGLFYTNASGVLAQTGTGGATQCLLGGAGTPTFGSCTGGSNTSPFYEFQGAIVPGNTTEDFILGGTASSSARFIVNGLATGISPTASISATNGNGIYLSAQNGTIQSLRNNTLSIGGNTTGIVAINPLAANFTGIGTSNPIASLDVRGSLGIIGGGTLAVASISGRTSYAALAVDNLSTVGDLFTASSSSNMQFVIKNNGFVGLATAAPTARLDVNGSASISSALTFRTGSGSIQTTALNSLNIGGSTTGNLIFNPNGNNLIGAGTSSPRASFDIRNALGVVGGGTFAIASVSGRTSFAALTVDNSLGDLFTASSSGLTRFAISQNGNVGIGTGTPLYAFDVNKKTAAFNSGQDGTISSWTNTTDTGLSGQLEQFGLVFINGYVYHVGGYDAPSVLDTVRYARVKNDGTLDNWVTSPNVLPEARLWHGTVTVNGYIYSIGGHSSVASPTNPAVYYTKVNSDGTISSWGSTTPLPSPRIRITHSVATANGYIYVVGGENSSAQTTVWYTKVNADGTLGPWLTGSSLPVATSDNAVVVDNGYIYSMGGLAPAATNAIYYAKINYDGSIGPWIGNPNNLASADSMHSGIVVNGFVYILGGINNSTTVYYAKFNANGTIPAFSTNPASLPDGHQGSGITYGNGYIYISGGFATDNVAYGSIARVSLAANLDLLGLTSTSIASSSGLAGGGSIFAGNIFAKNLEVGGSGTVWGNLAVSDTLSAKTLSISGRITGKALTIINETGNQAIFSASASGVTKFTIGNDGQVMIGNIAADPSTALGAGSIYYNTVSQALKFYNGSAWATIGTGSSSSGPFGVLQGAIVPTNTTYDFLLGGTATSSAKFAVLNLSGTATTVASVSGNLVVMPTNGTGGLLSIGTTNPSSKLHIFESVSDVAVTIETQGSNKSANLNLLSTSNTAGQISHFASGVRQWMIGNNGDITAGGIGIYTTSSNANRLAISSTGNVGIGTALSPTGVNPTSPLQVYGLSTQPIASISGKTSGPTLLLTNDGSGDILAASVSGVQKFRINATGDLIIGDGSGKIYGGGFDPLYTIDGKKFSTYASSINGMKEEYIGTANLAYDPAAGGYAYTLDFNNFEYGTELWTFSRVIDPDLTKVNVLLTPTSQARTWFRRDPVNRKLILYSDRPTSVTYRFTAPRFDYALYPSSDHSHDITGLQAPAAPNTTGTGEADPMDSFFASLSIQFNNGMFTILDGFGNLVHRVDGFSNLIAANLEAGFIHARNLAADTFSAGSASLGNATANTFAVAANTITIGGQDIRQFIIDTVTAAGFGQNTIISPLAEVETIKTNTIRSLTEGGDINVKGKLITESDRSATDSSVVSLDVRGSATISGSLATNSIQTNDATIAGTLRAGNLIADNIQGLEDKISSVASQFVNNHAATLAVGTVRADFGIFEQGITSMGPVTANILTATDQLAVGNNFTISNNAINTVGSDLAIQSLRQGAIAFQGGLIRMDTDGNMTVNGNFNLLGEIDAVYGVFSGTLTTPALTTDLISPVADSNISLSFKDSKFNIQNSKTASGSAVLSIDNKGNIQSSGSATFAKLNFNLVGKAEATSLSEAVATGSAGFASLRAGQPELTIKNNIITSKSLIYITPFGNTDNKVLYLLRQIPESETEDGSFTVGVSGPVPTHDMQFNWLIVN